ncbi:hypothetical protein EDD16DRAFT_1008691 [Pisolithus croceorrhizus]|nr:hypothetical protein EDD16DRAFT_1008691 [Pisolithus croceorrhizus]KAI6161514.1 hypothetical protein EDD17DRAFT_1588405 [Pisolithus thermaeus]
MTDLGFVPSLYDCAFGEVTGSDAPWTWLPNLLLPSLQELHPSDDFTGGNVPLPSEQTQTKMVAAAQFPSSLATQLTNQICPWTSFSYTCPNSSQSNSTSYSTSDGYVPFYPFFPLPNQNSAFWSLQEHVGFPFPTHPRYTRPQDLPSLHGPDVGGNVEPHASGILNDRTAQVLNDHPLCTLSDYETYPSRNHSTHIPENDTAGGRVDGHGNFDEGKFNSEQVVDLRPQSLLPPKQLLLPSCKLRSHHCVSRIEDRSLSGTFRRTRRSATQSRITMRLPKARSVCDHNVSHSCGWRDDKGRECGIPISYSECADHFAAAHDIKDIAWNVRIICLWCFSEPQKEVIRKNLLRHLREIHLRCSRSENGI